MDLYGLGRHLVIDVVVLCTYLATLSWPRPAAPFLAMLSRWLRIGSYVTYSTTTRSLPIGPSGCPASIWGDHHVASLLSPSRWRMRAHWVLMPYWLSWSSWWRLLWRVEQLVEIAVASALRTAMLLSLPRCRSRFGCSAGSIACPHIGSMSPSQRLHHPEGILSAGLTVLTAPPAYTGTVL